jgi:hypothetical protein
MFSFRKPPAQHPPQPFFHLVITCHTRTADPFPLLALFVNQYRGEVMVAGKFAAAGTDAAGTDRFLGVTDAASPLHKNLNKNKILKVG